MIADYRKMSLDQIRELQARSTPDSDGYKQLAAEIVVRQVETTMRAAAAAERSAAAANRASWAAAVAALVALATLLAKALGLLPP